MRHRSSPDQVRRAGKERWQTEPTNRGGKGTGYGLPGTSVILLGVALFVAALLVGIAGTMKSSHVYREALTTTHPLDGGRGCPGQAGGAWAVRDRLDRRVRSCGRSSFPHPPHSPLGAGTLYVTAEKRGGEWESECSKIKVAGRNEQISLVVPAADRRLQPRSPRRTFVTPFLLDLECVHLGDVLPLVPVDGVGDAWSTEYSAPYQGKVPTARNCSALTSGARAITAA